MPFQIPIRLLISSSEVDETESFEQLVRQTQQQEVIKNLVGSAKQFD